VLNTEYNMSCDTKKFNFSKSSPKILGLWLFWSYSCAWIFFGGSGDRAAGWKKTEADGA